MRQPEVVAAVGDLPDDTERTVLEPLAVAVPRHVPLLRVGSRQVVGMRLRVAREPCGRWGEAVDGVEVPAIRRGALDRDGGSPPALAVGRDQEGPALPEAAEG